MQIDNITLIKGTLEDCEDIYKQLSPEEQQKTNGFSSNFLTCVFRRVATIQSHPIGFVRLLKGIGMSTLSTEVMVLSDYRQQGVGTTLVHAAVEWYLHNNYYTNLYWLCDLQNIGSQRLAVKVGFQQVDMNSEYVTYLYTRTQ